ncbi:hypothetical protein [Ferrovum sp.]|jgi:hypothetical protein|uniref:hypothetical protein n=1 Tax=Ferrovum sp. TaxID=2609467 RepID=UPI00260BED21|nr:hypothetical protein [Ferrovum sp.]
MKHSKQITLVAAIASLILGGCSSTGPSMADIAKDQATADKIHQKAEADKLAKQQAAMKDEINSMPEWVVQVPPKDEKGFYAVGQGNSESMRVSMEKAKIDGEFGLAEQVKNSISGQIRQRDKDGVMGLQEDYSRLVDNLISEVSVSGYEVVHQDVRPIQGRFHSYVLLRLPFDSINRVVKEREAKSRDAEIKQDYADMAARIDKVKEEARRKEADQAARDAAIAASKQAVATPQTITAPSATATATTAASTPTPSPKSPADALPVPALDGKL